MRFILYFYTNRPKLWTNLTPHDCKTVCPAFRKVGQKTARTFTTSAFLCMVVSCFKGYEYKQLFNQSH